MLCFCGESESFHRLYKKKLRYHATATDEETMALARLKVPTAASLRINTMEFDIRTLRSFATLNR